MPGLKNVLAIKRYANCGDHIDRGKQNYKCFLPDYSSDKLVALVWLLFY